MRADEIGTELMAVLSDAGFAGDDELTLDELLDRVFGDSEAMQDLLISVGAYYAEPLLEDLGAAVQSSASRQDVMLKMAAWLACRFGLMLAAGALLEQRRREEMERLANDGGNDGD